MSDATVGFPTQNIRLKQMLLPVLAISTVLFASCRGVTSDATQGPPPTADITKLNHIVILAQENRGFEHYFGAMRQYWAANGYPDQSFDGLPQFNPASGAPPLLGPLPTNP